MTNARKDADSLLPEHTPAEGPGIRRIEPQISALLFDESHRGPLAATEVSSEHQQWGAMER